MTIHSLCDDRANSADCTSLCTRDVAVSEQKAKKQRMEYRAPCDECGLNPSASRDTRQFANLIYCGSCWASLLVASQDNVADKTGTSEVCTVDVCRESALVSEPTALVRAECCSIDTKIDGRMSTGVSKACMHNFQASTKITECSGSALEQEGGEVLCDECGSLPGVRQGLRQFAHLRYCEPCWASYMKIAQEENEKNASPLDFVCPDVNSDAGAVLRQGGEVLCDECGSLPGVHQGLRQFAHLRYCKSCWASYMKIAQEEHEKTTSPLDFVCSDGTPDAGAALERQGGEILCDECGSLPGVRQGRRHFAHLRYCEPCWASYMKIPQEENKKHASPLDFVCPDGNSDAGAVLRQGGEILCDECGSLPGVHQGLHRFAHLRYCEACWVSYMKIAEENAKKALPLNFVCSECDIPGAYWSNACGKYYCCMCWNAYQAKAKANACACASCGKRPALLKGSGSFSSSQYCMSCWCESVDVHAEISPSNPRSDVELWSWRNHYDFIEVGTSNWGTITQFCAGCDTGVASCFGEEIATPLVDLYFARGLAVEPVSAYLDSLPSLPNVTKVQCAMGESCCTDVLYGVSSENVRRYQGLYEAALPGGHPPGTKIDVMWYAVSLSSVGCPHPKLEPMLNEIARKDLLESWPVEVVDWSCLCKRHKVDSVDVVQIDCEGQDCSIVRGMLAYCEHHPRAYPRLLVFEANDLTDISEIQLTINSLISHGYYLRSWRENVIMERQ